MTDWIIGDVHGCWHSLRRLLAEIGWDPARDRLWLAGDLVNKGGGSLEVLRWAADPGHRVEAVLGNHDLHLLALAAGAARRREEDTLDAVLAAPDRDRLLGWLRRRPLVVEPPGAVVVHAGVLPSWSRADVGELARLGASALATADGVEAVYSRRKTRWSGRLEGVARAAAAVAVFTRLRVVNPQGQPRWSFTGPLADLPDGLSPWWQRARALGESSPWVFGHWAQLGLWHSAEVRCLDGACVYGGVLAAWAPAHDRLVTRPCDPRDRVG